MCRKIRCDGESEKFYKNFLETKQGRKSTDFHLAPSQHSIAWISRLLFSEYT